MEIWAGRSLKVLKFAFCMSRIQSKVCKAFLFFFKIKSPVHIINTFINAAAALRLMTATDSRLRRRGSRFRAERELENEQRDAVPGVMGVCGTLKPSTSSTMRKARPRAKGSTICTHTQTHVEHACDVSHQLFTPLLAQLCSHTHIRKQH